MTQRPLLALGPVVYNWEADYLADFYRRVARDSCFDRVYVGESICAKRDKWQPAFWRGIIDELLDHGKEVVYSSLALITNHHEMTSLDSIRQHYPSLAIEINDLGTLQLLEDHPFHVGPLVNCYNDLSVSYLSRRGAKSIIMPVETPLSAVPALRSASQAPLGLFVFGRMPLAISVRCYHARAHDLNKQHCQIICTGNDDGLTVATLEGENLFAVNGLQTQSFRYANALVELNELATSGVGVLYFSPQAAVDMISLAHLADQVLQQHITATEASQRLQQDHPNLRWANGYLHQAPGMTRIDTVSL